MEITEKEVRRIVSIHFKDRYDMDLNPLRMSWKYDEDMDDEVKSLDVGGDFLDEDDSNSA